MHGNAAGGRDEEGAPALEVGKRNGAVAPGGMVHARATARGAFAQKQGPHQQQGHKGNLRSAGKAGALQPGRIDADGQGLHTQILGRTQIIKAFHQNQCHARGQRRPRQRHGDAAEGTKRRLAQSARNLEHAYRLLGEACTGRQVNVRIEHR